MFEAFAPKWNIHAFTGMKITDRHLYLYADIYIYISIGINIYMDADVSISIYTHVCAAEDS